MDKAPDIDILGIKIYLPNTWVKLIAFVSFLSIASIATVQLVERNAEISINGQTLIFGKTNQYENLNEGFILSFWTPSEETKKAFELNNIPEDYKWQCNLNTKTNDSTFDSANINFAKEIFMEFNTSGYRRYEVSGEGRGSKFKKGWWWNVSIEGEYDESIYKRFTEVYIEFWDQDADWKTVYVEIIGKQKEKD